MYDISHPAEPRLASRLWLGGLIVAGGGVTVDAEGLASLGLGAQPEAPVVKGVKIQGGPQMLQLRWVCCGGCAGGWCTRLTAPSSARAGRRQCEPLEGQLGWLKSQVIAPGC